MFTMICLASYTRFDNIGIENTESITTHTIGSRFSLFDIPGIIIQMINFGP